MSDYQNAVTTISDWQRPSPASATTILAPFSIDCSLQKLFTHLEAQSPATAVHLILLQIHPNDSPNLPDEAHLYSQMKAIHGQMQHLPVTFEIHTTPGTLPATIITFAHHHDVDQILLCGATAVHATELKQQLTNQITVM